MSIEGGFYDEAVIVEFSTNEPNSVIRYTTNGNEPVLNHRFIPCPSACW
ncbi:MAG: chitobiase/beta-hexosaminidase C-terminal domain-containing protein [Bacteroidales bacterium]|nr:chitobiase/beta-hexosaminidase C-terminal domain-containing protein [Bacteroidales bacterium]